MKLFIAAVLILQDSRLQRGFWEGFEIAASAHSMLIAAVGSMLGEGMLTVTAYRKHNGVPEYYRKPGFWVARTFVLAAATLLPWIQGLKDAGVDRLVPFEVGLCAELLMSRFLKHD